MLKKPNTWKRHSNGLHDLFDKVLDIKLYYIKIVSKQNIGS